MLLFRRRAVSVVPSALRRDLLRRIHKWMPTRMGSLQVASLGMCVWLDANSNALVDLGEIKPSAAYLTELNVRPTLEGPDAYPAKGATLLDGTVVHTWDWWSRSAPGLGYPNVSRGFEETAPRVFISPTPKPEVFAGPR